MDPAVGQLYISVNLPQPGGTWAPSRSSPLTWWLSQCTNHLVMIPLGICSCCVPEERDPSPLNKRRNWKAAGNLSGSGFGYIWYTGSGRFYALTMFQKYPYSILLHLSLNVVFWELDPIWSNYMAERQLSTHWVWYAAVCEWTCVCLCVSVFVCLLWDRRLQFAEHALITWESTRSVAEFHRQTSAASHTGRLGEQVPLQTHTHGTVLWPFSKQKQKYK